MTETVGLIAGFLLFFVLFVYTFWPQRVLASQHEQTSVDDLLERKEQLSEDLRDLDFEFHAGKYSEGDYKTQRSQLENETAQLLAEIEQLHQA
jgi:hypothetical protein